MRRIDRWLGAVVVSLAVVAAPALGDDKKNADLYDCGKKICSDWAPKDENTCRTCKTVQCRKQGDKDLIVGEKKQNQCYTGHGDPPSEEELNQ